MKARSLELYARPHAGPAGEDAPEWEAAAGETPAAHVERLKGLLRAQWQEMLEVSVQRRCTAFPSCWEEKGEADSSERMVQGV